MTKFIKTGIPISLPYLQFRIGASKAFSLADFAPVDSVTKQMTKYQQTHHNIMLTGTLTREDVHPLQDGDHDTLMGIK